MKFVWQVHYITVFCVCKPLKRKISHFAVCGKVGEGNLLNYYFSERSRLEITIEYISIV